VIPEPDVRAALARLLASDNFVNAGRLSAFVRFAVERTLAGDGDKLKEYSIATEVFGRGADFDPRLDPVVRVEARRLRAKLQEYYEGSGRAEPVRIVIRKGGYTPIFEASEAQGIVPQSAQSRWPRAAAAIVLLVGIGAIAMRQAAVKRVPVVVFPHVEEGGEQARADRLSEALAGELSRDSRWQVVAWPKFAEYRRSHGGDAGIMIDAAAKDLGAAQVVLVSVQGDGHVFAVLAKPGVSYKEWFGEYNVPSGSEPASERDVARMIAAEIGKKTG
jgi:hypothetical protein